MFEVSSAVRLARRVVRSDRLATHKTGSFMIRFVLGN